MAMEEGAEMLFDYAGKAGMGLSPRFDFWSMSGGTGPEGSGPGTGGRKEALSTS
jgi:hypothetical protein